jgi:HPt (histidine-containing phosphotransfer) domain-containing protein
MPDISPNEDLDLSLLHEIADGSDEFIVESIDMFLQQTPESLTNISNALDAQDWAAAAAAAHKLKATLGFFGMLNSQALIQEIELSCKTGTPNAADVLNKFAQIQANVVANTPTLLQIKADAEAKL